MVTMVKVSLTSNHLPSFQLPCQLLPIPALHTVKINVQLREVLPSWPGTLGVELPARLQASHHLIKQQELNHQQLGRKMIRLNLMLHL